MVEVGLVSECLILLWCRACTLQGSQVMLMWTCPGSWLQLEVLNTLDYNDPDGSK
jgi:hypothetical protein